VFQNQTTEEGCTMKILLILFAMFSLTGCGLLKSLKSEPSEVVSLMATKYCERQDSIAHFDEYCNLDAWSEKLILSSTVAWSIRSDMIEALPQDPKSLLEKELLSQGNDTPYRNRLRAQKWIEELQTVTDKSMTRVLDILIYQPSQQLLELESAITILSKLNSRQAKTIAAQEIQLLQKNKEIEKQREQVKQLLDIEASMVNQNRTDSK
jgi:predicted small lipoprotein YifL